MASPQISTLSVDQLTELNIKVSQERAAAEAGFKARQAALENALTHEGQMAPQEAKWLK